ncbi:MAG TPA: hypothetical protein VNF72_07000 [Myxococcota bacterium]|nr:hypothetical protein [Myxococcota bacterium]
MEQRSLRPALARPKTRQQRFLAYALGTALGLASTPLAVAAASYDWQPLRIGGGGWLTGLDISADGTTRVVRTDTYGAYVWDAETSRWMQLVTSESLPVDEVDVERAQGVYEIRVAPNDASRLYMAFDGRVFRSDTRGERWTATTFARVSAMDPNDAFRTWGEKMAIDPANPDHVLVGTPRDGLFATRDGGAHWRKVADVPAGGQFQQGWPGITGIAFDPASGVDAGFTRGIYVASSAYGVYHSTDAGSTWTLISDEHGGPQSVLHAAVADGSYYATSPDLQNGKPSGVWKYSSAGWQDINPGDQYWHSIALDPRDSKRVVLGSDGGFLNVSANGGASWGGPIWQVSRKADDVPWLAWTSEEYLSNGAMRFDPHEPDRLWFAQGIGVWWNTLRGTTPASVVWTSSTRGIEQLVANAISAPPGGKPVLASWDRALFRIDDPSGFPSSHGPTRRFNMGWQVDYASSDPNTLVAFVSDLRGQGGDGLDLQSSFSHDGGRTWVPFPTMPLDSRSSWETFGFGTGAASSPKNVLWVPSGKRAPYVTQDGALTWKKVSLPGVPDTPQGWEGLHWVYYLNRHIAAADRVRPNTFYLYHTPKGLFRSTDGGDTWSLVHAGEVEAMSGFNASLRTVPSHEGHLFFTTGQQKGTTSAPSGRFMRSIDGGANWSAVPNVLEVHAFGFGAPASPGRYPQIYIAGWVKGKYGIWRSDDEAASWTQIGDFPLGSFDQVKAIDGDKNTPGKVYVGFQGSGYAYGVPPAVLPPASPTMLGP